jgi:hypothetical protein
VGKQEVLRTFQFRLMPNATQVTALTCILNDNAETYNAALQDAPVHAHLTTPPITPDDAAVYCPQLGEQFNKGNVFREVDQLSIAVPHPGAAGTYIRIRERLRNGKSRLVFPTLKQFRHWIVGATVVDRRGAC